MTQDGLQGILESQKLKQSASPSIEPNAIGRMMRYIAVDWHHGGDQEVLFASTMRLMKPDTSSGKVEEFRDGTLRCADGTHSDGSTFLAREPLPSDQGITSDTQLAG